MSKHKKRNISDMIPEELRKRLEEAAEKYADEHGFRVPYDGSNNFYDQTDVKASKDVFLAGAEIGYKEAIKAANEWLQSKCDFIDGDNLLHLDFNGECFCNYMNKLWEGYQDVK